MRGRSGQLCLTIIKKKYLTLNVGVHRNGISFPKEEEHNVGNDEKDLIMMKGETMMMIQHGDNREETEKEEEVYFDNETSTLTFANTCEAPALIVLHPNLPY